MAEKREMEKIEPEIVEWEEASGEILAVTAAPALPPDRNPALVYLASLRASGRRTMRQALDTIAAIASSGRSNAETLPWHSLRYQHTAAIRVALAERYKPATANKMLAALRQTLKEAWRLGYMSAEDYQRAADLKSVSGHSLPRGRSVESEELEKLLAVCQADPRAAGRRDYAMLGVLYGCGLRRSEIVKLDLADYTRAKRSLTVRGGKGGKDRLVFMGEEWHKGLEAWLAVRGGQAGPLFLRMDAHSKPTAKRLSDQAVLLILEKRAREAGVAKFSPHDLRRTFVSDLLEGGVDIATVQKMAGHASVTTTARYDRRGEAVTRAAAEVLKAPRKAPEVKE
ncbi:MAG TPA: tyrosine-type recombinase/integrase [Chloroflexia bacterium]|nr:tyrosine-type recombinase/integrase [Chloroflexia bacterium]